MSEQTDFTPELTLTPDLGAGAAAAQTAPADETDIFFTIGAAGALERKTLSTEAAFDLAGVPVPRGKAAFIR